VSDNSTEVEIGPIDYLVLEFPPGGPTGEGLPHLVDLVENGIIRILDIAFVAKDADGTLTVLDVNALGDASITVFEGASSGILGEDDIADAAAAVEAGRSFGILVYENSWAAPFATAMRRSGTELVANGRIPINAVIASLDAIEN
jgi:hypothetical protein